jgi:hypothetical protein
MSAIQQKFLERTKNNLATIKKNATEYFSWSVTFHKGLKMVIFVHKQEGQNVSTK